MRLKDEAYAGCDCRRREEKCSDSIIAMTQSIPFHPASTLTIMIGVISALSCHHRRCARRRRRATCAAVLVLVVRRPCRNGERESRFGRQGRRGSPSVPSRPSTQIILQPLQRQLARFLPKLQSGRVEQHCPRADVVVPDFANADNDLVDSDEAAGADLAAALPHMSSLPTRCHRHREGRCRCCCCCCGRGGSAALIAATTARATICTGLSYASRPERAHGAKRPPRGRHRASSRASRRPRARRRRAVRNRTTPWSAGELQNRILQLGPSGGGK